MKLKPPKNKNYCATVVELKEFRELIGCDNLKAAVIYGNQVIVPKNLKPGTVGLFFPVETALSKEFLSANNLYRRYFDKHGRVRCAIFLGYKSEGLFMGMESLLFAGDVTALKPGDKFDEFNGIPVCSKYIPRSNKTVDRPARFRKDRQPSAGDSIVDGQFRLHVETGNLRRNAYLIGPTEFVSITNMLHGTSVVISNVLVKRRLSLLEKIALRLGVRVQRYEYGIVYSSRRVIKGVAGESKETYTDDIWGTVAKEIGHKIEKGITLYGEIVGYTPSGQPIQSMGGKPYSYGCNPGEHKFFVYRITHTDPDGNVIEFFANQIIDYCQNHDLESVKLRWYGRWNDVGMDTDSAVKQVEQWFVNEHDCPLNRGLPEEGVVVRPERLYECAPMKLKNFRFLHAETNELDNGAVDVETAESLSKEE